MQEQSRVHYLRDIESALRSVEQSGIRAVAPTSAAPAAPIPDPAMLRLTRWIMASTIVTAICAIAAVTFVALQWAELHAGQKRIDRQIGVTERLASAAGHQAQASLRSVATAERQTGLAADMLHRSQRVAPAQVADTGMAGRLWASHEQAAANLRTAQIRIRMEPPRTAGQAPGVTWTIGNSGASPIVIKREWEQLIAGKPAWGDQAKAMLAGLRAAPSQSQLVQPGVELSGSQVLAQPLTPTEAAAAASGQYATRFLFGLEYQDAAGNIHHSYRCATEIQAGGGFVQAGCPEPAGN